MLPDLDVNDIMQRMMKYLIEGLAVAAAAFYIPRKKMNVQEIVMIAVTAAAIFSVLDLWAPGVSGAARQGAGFGIGASLVGGSVPSIGVPAL